MRFAAGEHGPVLLAAIILQRAGERPGSAGNTPPHRPTYGIGALKDLSLFSPNL